MLEWARGRLDVLPRARGWCHVLPRTQAIRRATRLAQRTTLGRRPLGLSRASDGQKFYFGGGKDGHFSRKNMVKAGDTFYAPATLWGEDYAELAYGDDWRDTKEHFRVVSKHKGKPGVWWCAYESADESDVEISAKSIKGFLEGKNGKDTASDSSVTDKDDFSKSDLDSDQLFVSSGDGSPVAKKKPKNKAKAKPTKRYVPSLYALTLNTHCYPHYSEHHSTPNTPLRDPLRCSPAYLHTQPGKPLWVDPSPW